MGLKNNEIEIKITAPKQGSYYEKLGYEILRHKTKNTIILGQEIVVNFDDIPKFSKLYVLVSCDDCGKVLEVRVADYNLHKKERGEYYCKSCTLRKRRKDEEIIRAKNGKSFAKWGIDNLGENFLDNYWDYEKNTCSPWLITYGSSIRIWIKCQKTNYHGSYETSCGQFKAGSRCSYCAGGSLTHIQDSLWQELSNRNLEHIWSNKNNLNPKQIGKQSNKKVWIECLDGKHSPTFRSVCNAFSCDFRCPECMKETDCFSKKSFILTANRNGRNGSALLYFIKCWNNEKTEFFYKIGRTIYDVEKRFKHHMPYNYEVVYTIRGAAENIYDFENSIHNKYSQSKYRPNIYFGGITECFIDLSENDVISCMNSMLRNGGFV